MYEGTLAYRDSAVNRKRREASSSAPPHARRYGACVLVSGGGEYLEAQSPLQLTLAIQRHNRTRRNRDPGDLERNQRLAADILAGDAPWVSDRDGDVFFHFSEE